MLQHPFPDALLGPIMEFAAALIDAIAPGAAGLVAAAAVAGIVTGLAFGTLAGAALTRRAARRAIRRLELLAGGDLSSPVAGLGRADLAGEVARATERVAAALKAAQAREAELRAAIAAAQARAAASESAAATPPVPQDGTSALAAAIAAVLAEELAPTPDDEEPRAAA